MSEKVKSRLEIANDRANGNVVDMFARKPIKEVAAEAMPPPHPKEIEEMGQYVGSLPKVFTEKLREVNQFLVAREAVINKLVAEYEQVHGTYMGLCQTGLMAMNLNLEQITKEGKSFYISEDGHIWIVKEQDLEKFAKFMNKRGAGNHGESGKM